MKKKADIVRLTQMAILTALIIVLSFTPLGYMHIGPLSVTFIAVPVAIGAIVLGPGSGAFLGLVFGLTSFAQAFGLEYFGTMLFSINPFFTAVMCIVPRVLMGFLCGLIFKGFMKTKLHYSITAPISSLLASVMNTVLFMTALLTLFGSSEYIKSMQGSLPILEFAVTMVGVQGVVEALICTVVSSAVCIALIAVNNHRKTNKA